MATRLSHNGYRTTVNAEQKHQIIPMTTHAVSPCTPKMVLAKKSGSGIKISMITVWWASNRQNRYQCGERSLTKATEDHAAKRNALSSATGSRSGSGAMIPSSSTAECASMEPCPFSDPFSNAFSSLYSTPLVPVGTGALIFNARLDSKSKSSGHCASE
jgi:hypothetical protein